MKRLLLAFSPRNAESANSMFERVRGRYEISLRTSFDDVMASLNPATDVIVADTEFNGGRPHKLLCKIRSLPECASVPLLYLKCAGGPSHLPEESFRYAPHQMHGGDGFFDFTRWSSQLGPEYARAKLHIWIDHIVSTDLTEHAAHALG